MPPAAAARACCQRLPIGRRMIRREHRTPQIRRAGSPRIINCYCNLVDREGRGSLRCCKPLSGIKKSQFFAETADHYARCSAVTRGLKEKCAAKPEEHRGNALFALPDPFTCNHSPGPLRQAQKVPRTTRS